MKVCIALISIGIVLLVFGGYLICSSSERGALYINQGGINVYICDGIFKNHGEKTMHFAFYCDNGTIVENLVNFTIKEN